MSVNKLVRDNIPNIIKQSGRSVEYRTLGNDEYLFELEKKLQEEVDEYIESKNIEELADVIEVVYALAKARGNSIAELENIRRNKVFERGAFDNKIFLIKNN